MDVSEWGRGCPLLVPQVFFEVVSRMWRYRGGVAQAGGRLAAKLVAQGLRKVRDPGRCVTSGFGPFSDLPPCSLLGSTLLLFRFLLSVLPSLPFIACQGCPCTVSNNRVFHLEGHAKVRDDLMLIK